MNESDKKWMGIALDEAGRARDIDEVPIGLLAPTRPLTDPLVAHRNRRSLDRLAELMVTDITQSVDVSST